MMKNLFENQCGAQNPLVQLGNQLKIANEQQQHKSVNFKWSVSQLFGQ